uniref:Uncharacterized protein n=1 Tax=Rhizophora mucronata TaxID=61149 RepID=A0A2P2PN69_RHIMU
MPCNTASPTLPLLPLVELASREILGLITARKRFNLLQISYGGSSNRLLLSRERMYKRSAYLLMTWVELHTQATMRSM